MIVTTDAVILHGRNHGDTSRIVLAYTETHGLLSLMAKGSRRPASNMSGALEAMRESKLTLYVKPGRDLHHVRSAEAILQRGLIRRSYDHMVAGLAVCDFVVRTQAHGAVHPELWRILRDGFRVLDAGNRPWLDAVAMRLAMASVMGFGISKAGHLGDAIAVSVRLADGMVMNEIHASATGMLRMSAAAWRIIEGVLANEGEAQEVQVVQADRDEIEGFLRLYVGHHLDKSIGIGIAELLK